MLHDDYQLLHSSLLYREFLSERDEILRHKWLESEKLVSILDLNALFWNGF